MQFLKIGITTLTTLCASLFCVAGNLRTELEAITTNITNASNSADVRKLEDKLFLNTEALDIIPHLYGRTMLQAEHHREMVELLQSSRPVLDKLDIYGKKNGRENIINVSRIDIDKLWKTKSLKKLTKTNVEKGKAEAFLNNYFGDAMAENRSDRMVISHWPIKNVKDLQERIKITIPEYSPIAACIFEELALMSVAYFLETEQRYLSLFDGLVDNLSTKLDQTLEQSLDIILPFMVLYDIYDKQDGYNFGQKAVIKADAQDLLDHYGFINIACLKELINSDEMQNALPDFYFSFFDIMQIFGRRTSMTDFTTTISAEDFTKREELATPLECEKGKHQQIYSKYTAEFSKKKKKRNGIFTRRAGDILSPNYDIAARAILEIHNAYYTFNQEKTELREKYNQKILEEEETEQDKRARDEARDFISKFENLATDVPPSLEAKAQSQTESENDQLKTVKSAYAKDSYEYASLPERALEENHTFTRKPKRWHNAELMTRNEDSKPSAASTDTIMEYHYGADPLSWPQWIQDLKEAPMMNIKKACSEFAKSITEGGLGGTVISENNKYVLMLRSPVTGIFCVKGGHELHHGSDRKRFPAIRKAFLELLTEAMIIPR